MLFYDLKIIFELHFNFIKRLNEIQEEIVSIESFTAILNSMFLGDNMEKLKYAYGNYCALQETASAELRSAIETNSDLCHFLNHQKKLPFMKKLSFMDFRASVYQRIVKYPILLESIIKNYNEKSVYFQILMNIINECKSIVIFVNYATDQYNKFLELNSFCHKINWKLLRQYAFNNNNLKSVGIDLDNFDFLNEMLVHHCTVTLLYENKKNNDITMLILTHYIVFLTRVSDKKYNPIQATSSKGHTLSPFVAFKGLVIRKMAESEYGIYLMSTSDMGSQIINLYFSSQLQMETNFNILKSHLDNIEGGKLQTTIDVRQLHEIVCGNISSCSELDINKDYASKSEIIQRKIESTTSMSENFMFTKKLSQKSVSVYFTSKKLNPKRYSYLNHDAFSKETKTYIKRISTGKLSEKTNADHRNDIFNNGHTYSEGPGSITMLYDHSGNQSSFDSIISDTTFICNLRRENSLTNNNNVKSKRNYTKYSKASQDEIANDLTFVGESSESHRLTTKSSRHTDKTVDSTSSSSTKVYHQKILLKHPVSSSLADQSILEHEQEPTRKSSPDSHVIVNEPSSKIKNKLRASKKNMMKINDISSHRNSVQNNDDSTTTNDTVFSDNTSYRLESDISLPHNCNKTYDSRFIKKDRKNTSHHSNQ